MFSTHGASDPENATLRAIFRSQSLYRAQARERTGALLVETPVWKAGDDLCCPGKMARSEYTWSEEAKRHGAARQDRVRARHRHDAVNATEQVVHWGAMGTPLRAGGREHARVAGRATGRPSSACTACRSPRSRTASCCRRWPRAACAGVAFDLPGLGFADRPREFDYSWSGLGAWSLEAVDALGLERFHLVVHDIGGPIGFDLARRVPDRVLSLTALNTMVRVASFKRPWFMEPYARRVIGPVNVALSRGPAIVALMRWKGVSSPVPAAELKRPLAPAAPRRRRLRVPPDHALVRADAGVRGGDPRGAREPALSRAGRLGRATTRR